MLKTVKHSANKKTGPIAVTYRAGGHNVFATCPKTCALNPQGEHAADLVDLDYLAAVRQAVPRGGQAWTYSHFPAELLPMPAPGETVINASCDSIPQALAAIAAGRPAVVAAPAGTVWPYTADGVRFVQCPAELADNFSCAQCGNGRPLCARGERDYVVVFVAHGSPAAAMVMAARFAWPGKKQKPAATRMMRPSCCVLRAHYRLVRCCATTWSATWARPDNFILLIC